MAKCLPASLLKVVDIQIGDGVALLKKGCFPEKFDVIYVGANVMSVCLPFSWSLPLHQNSFNNSTLY